MTAWIFLIVVVLGLVGLMLFDRYVHGEIGSGSDYSLDIHNRIVI